VTSGLKGDQYQHVINRIEDWHDRVTHIFDVRGELAGDNAGDRGLDWQQKQSWVAIGSGGIFGKGLGNGKQKFYFLPMVHTDFIFALIGEEWGLVGSLMIFLLFLIFLWRGLFLALRAPSTYNRLLTAGLVFMVIDTAIIHLGVTLHLLPPTGQTLPFVSYGGSALAANMLGVGIILQLSKQILRSPIENDMAGRGGNWWTHLSGARAR
jgi:cell division protein FtsW (lipid II flippase)